MIIAIVASVMIGAFFGAALMACLSMSKTEQEPEIDTEFASPYDNGHNIQRYPITEIPTPHGRLIDADLLIHMLEITLVEKQVPYGFIIAPTKEQKQIIEAIIHQINRLPTIIKAEENDEK